MSSDKLFLRSEDGPTFEHPGPFIAANAFADANSLLQKAKDAIYEWNRLCHKAVSRIPTMVPQSGRKAAQVFLDYVRGVGTRLWMRQVFIVAIPIGSKRELRSWCTLQLLATELWRVLDDPDSLKSEIKVAFYGETPLRELSKCEDYDIAVDEDSIRAAIPLLYDIDIELELHRKAWLDTVMSFRIETISWETPASTKKKARSKYQSLLTGLVQTAWQYMRNIGKSWPIEPNHVRDLTDVRQKLDIVMNWCADDETNSAESTEPNRPQKSALMESAASVDTDTEKRGPVRPFVVVDEFTSHALAQLGIGIVQSPNLKGLSRAIFEVMRLRDWMQENEFIQHVWGIDGATTSAMKQAIHRFNSDPNAPFILIREDGKILKNK